MSPASGEMQAASPWNWKTGLSRLFEVAIVTRMQTDATKEAEQDVNQIHRQSHALLALRSVCVMIVSRTREAGEWFSEGPNSPKQQKRPER